jgi:hypothetical protein
VPVALPLIQLPLSVTINTTRVGGRVGLSAGTVRTLCVALAPLGSLNACLFLVIFLKEVFLLLLLDHTASPCKIIPMFQFLLHHLLCTLQSRQFIEPQHRLAFCGWLVSLGLRLYEDWLHVIVLSGMTPTVTATAPLRLDKTTHGISRRR